MKTNRLTTLLASIAISGVLTAQIRVEGTNANVSVGSTGTPVTNAKMQVSGNSVFMQTNTTITSSPMIIGTNGYSNQTAPDYTYYGDNKTGLFHPAPGNILGFTINGSEKMRIHNNGKMYLNTQPSALTWQDGVLSIGGIPNTNEAAIKINVNHIGDWGTAITTNVTRPFTTAYGLSLNGAAKFYVAGAGWLFANNAYFPSDQTLKEDIATIPNGLATILKLRGVKYKWTYEKQDPTNYGLPEDYFGLVAQEVEQVIQSKSVVKQMPEGIKAISYNSIIPFLVEAIKEQNKRIDSLQIQLNDCCVKKNGNNGNNHRMINDGSTIEGNEEGSWIKQNRPNPFNNQTIIEFNIVSGTASASIMIFDVNGKTLKSYSVKTNGKGSLTILSNEFSSGLYYYSLVTDGVEVDTKKMIITE